MNNWPFLKLGAFFVVALLVFLSLPINKSSFVVSTSSVAPPPNLKVAFVGDTGNGNDFQRALQLIKDEGADIVLHQGDFDSFSKPLPPVVV